MLYKIGLSKLMLLVVVIELQASLVSISLNFSKKLHSRASVASFETYITFQILQGMLSNMANTFLGSTVSENHVFVRYLSLEKIVFMGTWLPKPKSGQASARRPNGFSYVSKKVRANKSVRTSSVLWVRTGTYLRVNRGY
jgi:hypothetical protein